MIKNRSGNASGIGTATHPIKRFAKQKKSTQRRSRYRCVFYEPEARYCKKLQISCVGLSNEMCKYYRTEHLSSSSITEGMFVHDEMLGLGMIISSKYPVYRVKYVKHNREKLYNHKEIQTLVKNIDEYIK